MNFSTLGWQPKLLSNINKIGMKKKMGREVSSIEASSQLQETVMMLGSSYPDVSEPFYKI